MRLRLDETHAAARGGAVTGALVGLKADLLSGGLTLGGGLLAGGLLGALGSAGLARCVNLVRGTDRSFVAWNAAALDAMIEAALLRLLAVEHFGRGRGDWARSEGAAALEGRRRRAAPAPYRRGAFASGWSKRVPAATTPVPVAAVAERLEPVLRGAAWDALRALYPDAGMAPEAPENGRPRPERCHDFKL